jgi:hypothetical protein
MNIGTSEIGSVLTDSCVKHRVRWRRLDSPTARVFQYESSVQLEILWFLKMASQIAQAVGKLEGASRPKKQENFFDITFRMPNFGVGEKLTRKIWKRPDCYWTVAQVVPRLTGSEVFFDFNTHHS